MTGEKGIYNPQNGILQMTENVVVYQGNNHVSGDTATINLETGESSLIPKEKSKRVKGRLIPEELKGLSE